MGVMVRLPRKESGSSKTKGPADERQAFQRLPPVKWKWHPWRSLSPAAFSRDLLLMSPHATHHRAPPMSLLPPTIPFPPVRNCPGFAHDGTKEPEQWVAEPPQISMHSLGPFLGAAQRLWQQQTPASCYAEPGSRGSITSHY